MRWKPGLTFRENHVDGRSGIQLSDALDRRRLLVSKKTLLSVIANTRSEECTESLVALQREGVLGEDWSKLGDWQRGMSHWEARNWTLALSYYLWARRDEFLDEGPNYEEIRCEALQSMLSESSVPLPDFVEPSERVDLGKPAPIPENITLGEVLRRRVTTQVFNAQSSIPPQILAGVLSNGFSVSRRFHVPDIEEHIHNLLHGVGFAFDPYVVVFNVEGLKPGIYFYSISQDSLRLESEGDFRQEVCAGLIGHQQALSAGCTIFLVVDFRRFQWRYRHERALRNLYVDVGRMAQYFILIATAYGLRNHITPATVDSSLATLLKIDSERRQVFYSITLGN
jgi:SagB-type dehydrogenase family enzyme